MNAASNGNGQQWGNRFQELLQACQTELKKTTQIGMKMLSASQSNTELHEEHEALGILVVNAIKSGELDWENESVKSIIENIDKLKDELHSFEEEVQNLKSQEE
jgi:superfamily I DNA/RNA helicase